MLPVVCGSVHSARITPTVGAVDHAVYWVPIDAGALKSCGVGVAVVVPVIVLPGRQSWNKMSLPATAAVTPISTRTPTTHKRTVVPATMDVSGLAVVTALVTDTRAV